MILNVKDMNIREKKYIPKAHKKVYKAFNITHENENKLYATVEDQNKYVYNI